MILLSFFTDALTLSKVLKAKGVKLLIAAAVSSLMEATSCDELLRCEVIFCSIMNLL